MPPAPRPQQLALKNGKRVTALQIDALRIAAKASEDEPVTSSRYPWNLKVVRALEDKEWVEIGWIELDDYKRKGAWQIEGITPAGREIIALWDAKFPPENKEK